VNSKLEYGTDPYTDRKYYLNNYTFDNTTDELYLYNILSARASDVVLTVYDKNNGQRLSGAYVKMLRYYPALDNTTTSAAYKTVEIEKTDSNGQTLGKFILGDVWYKFIIEYPAGTVVYNGDIQKILTTDMLIPVSLTNGNLLTWNSRLKLNSDVTCTKSTGTCRLTWSTSDGTEITGELRIYEDTGFSKHLISSQQATSSAATLSYLISNTSGKHIIAEGWMVE
jgi:hypothetical protein